MTRRNTNSYRIQYACCVPINSNYQTSIPENKELTLKYYAIYGGIGAGVVVVIGVITVCLVVNIRRLV